MSTKVTYPSVTAGEDEFNIPFTYLRPEDVEVLVDGVAVSFTLPVTSTAKLATPATGGENVTVQRATDIDNPYATFTEIITTSNLNNQVLQLLYNLQEVDTRIDSLNLGSLDPDYVPPATATDKVLLSQNDGLGGFEWAAVDRTSILDFTIPTSVGLADDTFLVVESNAWVSKTLAEVQALVQGSSALPDAANQSNNFLATNAAGDGYQLLNQTDARTTLGLGTAAVKNEGTDVGNVLTIADDGDFGGTPGNPALPVIAAGGLTGIAITPEVAVFRRVLSATGAENAINNGDDVLKYGAFEGTAPSWVTAYDDGSDGTNEGVEILTAGTYEIDASVTAGRSGVFGGRISIDLTGGTVLTNYGLWSLGGEGGFGENVATMGHKIFVTVAANTQVRVTLESNANLTTGISSAFSVSVGEPTAYLRIKKVA